VRLSSIPEANLFLLFTRRLNKLGVSYMVSGSVAVIVYGEPRLTHDVDLVAVLDRQHITRLPEPFRRTSSTALRKRRSGSRRNGNSAGTST
jgi:hypothetical protein